MNPLSVPMSWKKELQTVCITNIDGEFTLNTPTNATLVISFIGYQPVTIALNGQKTLNVQMQEEALSLETVVVTAMGIKKKQLH
ncbi:MAG: carboxypeptidase-like regulatory domain-containing protein [Bacteroides cellulosilyticus]